MAFTSAEKASIRYYLGWQSRFYQIQSKLETAMSLIEEDVDASALIRADLARLKEIDDAVKDITVYAGVKRAGNVELNHSAGLASLRSDGRQTVGRISSILGVEINHDVFSPSGAGANGGLMRHG